MTKYLAGSSLKEERLTIAQVSKGSNVCLLGSMLLGKALWKARLYGRRQLSTSLWTGSRLRQETVGDEWPSMTHLHWPTSFTSAPYPKVFIPPQLAPSMADCHPFTSWSFGEMLRIHTTSTRISEEVLPNHSGLSYIDASVANAVSQVRTEEHAPPIDFCLRLFPARNAHREEWVPIWNISIYYPQVHEMSILHLKLVSSESFSLPFWNLYLHRYASTEQKCHLTINPQSSSWGWNQRWLPSWQQVLVEGLSSVLAFLPEKF